MQDTLAISVVQKTNMFFCFIVSSSICLSFRLAVCLCIRLAVFVLPSVFLPVCLSECISTSIYFFFRLPPCLPICLSIMCKIPNKTALFCLTAPLCRLSLSSLSLPLAFLLSILSPFFFFCLPA